METKGNKIFHNIKTRWNSMMSPIKWMLSKYHILVVKMALYVALIPYAQSNIFLFTNVETLLGLNAMMPLLEALHSLIKFAQLKDVLFVIASPLSKVMYSLISKP